MFALLAVIFNPITELQCVTDKLNQEIPGQSWECKEIGDGNINFIYLAKGDSQQLILKKALDFARINPEAFPLPVDRLLYEYRAYTLYRNIVPEFVPEIFFFDQELGVFAMQYLSPHAVLRTGLMDGNQYPLVGKHLGLFLARALYYTSKYHLSAEEWQKNIAMFQHNTAMREIILNLNYTDPFRGSSLNWWTTPELDDLVQEIQTNPKISSAISLLKHQFLTFPEALSHGDLHTGSILVTADDTRVIDPEFASYAPISFDIGMLMANFVMASLAQPENMWLKNVAKELWDVFAENFPVKERLDSLWKETTKLVGVEIIRRTIGVAHNADFEKIQDRARKVKTERTALSFAIRLLINEVEYDDFFSCDWDHERDARRGRTDSQPD